MPKPALDAGLSGFDYSSGHYTKKVRTEKRAVRRREGREKALLEIYNRLLLEADADFILDRIFSVYRVSSGYQNRYKKTHRMLGPGATCARSYITALVTPRDSKVSKNGVNYTSVKDFGDTNSHTLEDFLVEPWYLNKMGSDVIDDVANIAVCSPSEAAKQAQSMLRRAGYLKAVCGADDFCRSRKQSGKLIADLSEELGKYDNQIETLVENNWITMIGPNGIGDWEVTGPLACVIAVRDLYAVSAVLGFEMTLLLFESEMSILNITISPSLMVARSVGSLENFIERKARYEPYAAVEVESFGSGDLSTPVSLNEVQRGHNETIMSLEPNYRSRLNSLMHSILPFEGVGGKGCAISIGANTLLTASHLAFDASGDSGNSRVTQMGFELAAVVAEGCTETAWNFRSPTVGEKCVFLYRILDEVKVSEPVYVFEISNDGCVITDKPSYMKEGNSGSALVALSDLSLVGVLQGRSAFSVCELLSSSVSNAMFWEVACSLDTGKDRTGSVYDSFKGRELRCKFNDIVDAIDCDSNGINSVRMPSGWYYRLEEALQIPSNGDGEVFALGELNIVRMKVARSSGHIGSMTVRTPKYGEACAILRINETGQIKSTKPFILSEIGPYGTHGLKFSRHFEKQRSGLIVAISDCAVIGVSVRERPNEGFAFDEALNQPESDTSFLGDVSALTLGRELQDILSIDPTVSVQIFRRTKLQCTTFLNVSFSEGIALLRSMLWYVREEDFDTVICAIAHDCGVSLVKPKYDAADEYSISTNFVVALRTYAYQFDRGRSIMMLFRRSINLTRRVT